MTIRQLVLIAFTLLAANDLVSAQGGPVNVWRIR